MAVWVQPSEHLSERAVEQIRMTNDGVLARLTLKASFRSLPWSFR